MAGFTWCFNAMTDLIVRDLGLQPYRETWEAMQSFTAQRDDSTVDELWCLEHPRVYTQGQAGKAEHILAPGDIPVVHVDRGGQVTYHGPGQLVIYVMLDISRSKIGIRTLVEQIELSIIQCLAEFGIEAAARRDAPGVYVADAKVASLGLRVRRGCSFHGLALNVNMDMTPFSRINPCGYVGLQMCQVSDFDKTATVAGLSALLSATLAKHLGYAHPHNVIGWQ